MDDANLGTTIATRPMSRGRKADRRRSAILRAAIETINAKSYALATMSEIAATLDLRDATLYYYFPSKRALVYACHVHSLDRFERLVGIAAASEGNGAAKLRRFIGDFFAESHANGPQLYFGDHSYLDPDQRKVIDDWAARLSTTVQSFIATGIADASIGPCEPELVVQLLLGMFIWLAKWVPAAGTPSPERMTAAVEACVLRGLATETDRSANSLNEGCRV